MKNYKYIPKRFYSLVKKNIESQPCLVSDGIKFDTLKKIESNKRVSVRVLISAFTWRDTLEGFTSWKSAYNGDFSKLEKYLEL